MAVLDSDVYTLNEQLTQTISGLPSLQSNFGRTGQTPVFFTMGFFATVERFETCWVDGAGGTAGRAADLASLGTVKRLETLWVDGAGTAGKVADLARHGMLGASTTGEGGTTIGFAATGIASTLVLRAILMPS